MAEVHGTCEPRFDAVRTTLADQIETGADLGASVAVGNVGPWSVRTPSWWGPGPTDWLPR